MVKVRRGYRSRNVEYRGSARRSGGFGFPMPQSSGGKAGAGLGGAGIIGVIIALVMAFAGGGGGFGQVGLGPTDAGGQTTGAAPERDTKVEGTFDDIQFFWDGVFEASEVDYVPASLVVFTGLVDTGGCGQAPAAVGPFYCPADHTAYFDPAFFEEFAGFGEAGDFAQAYVIAHELGHHIQNVTGVSAEVRQRQQGQSQQQVNDLSIRLELQADCLAGVWASDAVRRPENFDGGNILYLDRGDLDEGLLAAALVGDDKIQERAGAQVDPHNWNHGSAAQRQAWLVYGVDSGDPSKCQETFDFAIAGTEIMPR